MPEANLAQILRGAAKVTSAKSRQDQLGLDQYGHTDIQQTDTDNPFQNLYQTDNDICFETHIIRILILNNIKPIPIPIQISEFISNRYRYDFILADTDTYYRYQYRLYRLSLL